MRLSAWGGSEHTWFKTAIELADQGFRVKALLTPAEGNLWHRKELIHHSVQVGEIPSANTLWQQWRSSRGASIERELLSANPADLVIIFQGDSFCGRLWMRWCEKLGRKFVTIVQGSRPQHWLNDAGFDEMRELYPKAARAYFVAQHGLDQLRLKLVIDLPQAVLLRNTYQVRYDQEWKPVPEQTPLRLACVARLDPGTKGQDLILQALASELWRNRDYELHFYGSGQQQRALEHLANKLNLTLVYFAGFTKHIETIWQQNHALILPSRYDELAIALVEAMLCGRPALVTDVGDHAKVVSEGATGFIAATASVEAVAQALERLWENRARLGEMGELAGQRVREWVPKEPIKLFAAELVSLVE